MISMVGLVRASSPKAGRTKKMKGVHRRLEKRISLLFIGLSPCNEAFSFESYPNLEDTVKGRTTQERQMDPDTLETGYHISKSISRMG
jgi:hypothetical protein